MQIAPLTKENHSFKAIYRIPYSEKALSELQQKVLPTYKKVFNQKCDFFNVYCTEPGKSIQRFV